MDWRGFGVVALFLMVACEKGGAILRMLRGNPPEKRQVSFEEEYTSKHEFAELKQKVAESEQYGADRRKAIYKMIDDKSAGTDLKLEAFRREVKEDMGGLHDKINDLANNVSASQTQCEMINTQVLHVSSQLNQMLQKRH
ncbi:MAG TPA: hypothetical protein VK633_06380 [Verrucomicrobiae bacterium]|nr:hypothetical protein [Verrucomicrobiae bacterium]